jgi:Protein of unknown function (DUF1570)
MMARPTAMRPARRAPGWAALAGLVLALAAAAEPGIVKSAWKFDAIHLKNGSVLRGLIVEETPTHVRFQNVRRQPGRPTVVFTTLLARSDITRWEKLSDEERKLLKARLDQLDPANEGERQRMEELDLQKAAWAERPNTAFRYDSDQFSLLSNAPEDIVRRSAVRLEQIYTAYSRFLTPRHKGAAPTSILLYASVEEYQKANADRGRKFVNPAFFDPTTNRIVCACDLQRLGEDLEEVQRKHRELRDDLDKQEAELRRLYAKNKDELARHLQSVTDLRKRIADADRRNDAVFDKATRQLFSLLYHEAFHAYVNSFVYPPATNGPSEQYPGELPRWLNEGLAQVFETAIIEAGELRVGHAERDRLFRTKELVRCGEVLPLKDLLRSGSKQFIVVHGGDRFESDRAYLTSWALSHYLMFERKLIGTAELDTFVRQLNEKADPVEAFTKLIAQSLESFEMGFHRYVLRLQPDGSLTADAPPGK